MMEILAPANTPQTEKARGRAGIAPAAPTVQADRPYHDMPDIGIPEGEYSFSPADVVGVSGDIEAGADTAKAIGTGAIQIASGIMALAEMTGVVTPGAATGPLNELTAKVVQSMSPSARNELARKFASLDQESVIRNPKAIWLNLMQQVPQLAAAFASSGAGASLATGGKAGRLAAGVRAAEAGKKAADAARTAGALMPGQVLARRAAQRAAMAGYNRAAMIGGAAVGGLQEGTMTAGDAANTIISEIMALEGVSDEEKRALVQQVHERGDVADVFAMATVTGAPGGAVIGRLTRGLRTAGPGVLGPTMTRPARALGYAGAEAGQETLQEGLQAIQENIAAGATYDPGRPVTQNVGERAAAGGITGFFSGGALGALHPSRMGVDDPDIDAALKGAEDKLQEMKRSFTPPGEPPAGGTPSDDISAALRATIVNPRRDPLQGEMFPGARPPPGGPPGGPTRRSTDWQQQGLPLGDEGPLFQPPAQPPGAQGNRPFVISSDGSVQATSPGNFVRGMIALHRGRAHRVIAPPDVLSNPATQEAMQQLRGNRPRPSDDVRLNALESEVERQRLGQTREPRPRIEDTPFVTDPATGNLIFSNDRAFLDRVRSGDSALTPTVAGPRQAAFSGLAPPEEQMGIPFPPAAERLAGAETYEPDYTNWTGTGKTQAPLAAFPADARPVVNSETGKRALKPVAPFTPMEPTRGRKKKAITPKRAERTALDDLLDDIEIAELNEFRKKLKASATLTDEIAEAFRTKKRVTYNLKNWKNRIPVVSADEVKKKLKQWLSSGSTSGTSDREVLNLLRAYKGLPSPRESTSTATPEQSPVKVKADKLAREVERKDREVLSKKQRELDLDYTVSEERVAAKQKSLKKGRPIYTTRSGKEVTARDAIAEAWTRFTKRYVEQGSTPTKEDAAQLLRELQQLEARDRAVEKTLQYRHPTAAAMYSLTEYVDLYRQGGISAEEFFNLVEPELESFKDQRLVRPEINEGVAARQVRKELSKRGTQGRPQITSYSFVKSGKRKGRLLKKGGMTTRPVAAGERQLKFPFAETTAAQKNAQRQAHAEKIVQARVRAHKGWSLPGDSVTRWYAGPQPLPSARPPVSLLLDPSIKATYDALVEKSVDAGVSIKEAKALAFESILNKAKSRGEKSVIRSIMSGKLQWEDVVKDVVYERLAIAYVSEAMGIGRIDAAKMVREHINGMRQKPAKSPFGNPVVRARVNEILAGTKLAQDIAKELEKQIRREPTEAHVAKKEDVVVQGSDALDETAKGEKGAVDRTEDEDETADTTDLRDEDGLPVRLTLTGEEEPEDQTLEEEIANEEVKKARRLNKTPRKPRKTIAKKGEPSETTSTEKPPAAPKVTTVAEDEALRPVDGRAGAAGTGATASTGREPRGVENLTPIKDDTPRVVHEGSYPDAVEQPFSYQFDAANMVLHRMNENPDGSLTLLADDPGMGKTMPMLLVAFEMLQRGQRVLILANNKEGALAPFVREAARLNRLDLLKQLHFASYMDLSKPGKGGFTPNKYSDDVVSKIVKAKEGDSLRGTGPSIAVAVPEGGYGLLIADEAHALKKEDIKTSKGAAALQAKHRLYTTATPADAYNSLAVIAAMRDQSVEELITEAGGEVVSKNEKDGSMVVKPQDDVSHTKFHLNLANIVASLMDSYGYIRRKLHRNLAERELVVDMNEQSTLKYTDGRAYSQVATDLARLYHRVRESNDPSAVSFGNTLIIHMTAVGEWVKAEAVLKDALKQIKEGKQVVILTERKGEGSVTSENLAKAGLSTRIQPAMMWLKEQFEANGHSVGLYTPNVTAGGETVFHNKDLEGTRRKFQSGAHQVIIGQIEALGKSVDLDDQSPKGNKPRVEYILTPPWSYSQKQQAERRIARATTTSAAEVVIVRADNLLSDSRRMSKLLSKEDVADILGDPRAVITRGGRSARSFEETVSVSDSGENVRVTIYTADRDLFGRFKSAVASAIANTRRTDGQLGLVVIPGLGDNDFYVRKTDWPVLQAKLRDVFGQYNAVVATTPATPTAPAVTETPQKKSIRKKGERRSREEVLQEDSKKIEVLSSNRMTVSSVPELAKGLGYDTVLTIDTKGATEPLMVLIGNGYVNVGVGTQLTSMPTPENPLEVFDSGALPPSINEFVRDALKAYMGKSKAGPSNVPLEHNLPEVTAIADRVANAFEGVTDTDAKMILNMIPLEGDLGQLVNRMLTALGSSNLPVSFSMDQAGGKQGDSGAYFPIRNKITLDRSNLDNAGLVTVFLHEVVHALSYFKLRMNPLFRARVNSLYRQAKRIAKQRGGAYENLYGLNDIDEFLSEALSNRDFRAFLRQVAVPKQGAIRSALGALARLIKVHVLRMAPTPESRADNLLDEILSFVPDALSKAPGPITRFLFSGDPVGYSAAAVTGRARQMVEDVSSKYGTKTIRGWLRRGVGLPFLNTSAIASWFSDPAVFKDLFQSDEKVGNLLQNVTDVKARLTKYSEEYLTQAGLVHRALNDGTNSLSPDEKEQLFGHFMDTTIYQMWPDAPFDDPGGKNHHLMYLRSKDENGQWNKRDQADIDILKPIYDRIAANHAALPDSLKNVYTQLTDFYQREWEDTTFQLMRNMLYAFDLVWSSYGDDEKTLSAEASPAMTVEEKDELAKRFMEGVTVGDMLEETKQGKRGRFDAVKRLQDGTLVFDTEMTEEVTEQIARIQHRSKLDGPYIGAKRYGDYVTESVRNERELAMTSADIELDKMVEAVRDKFNKEVGELVPWNSVIQKRYQTELRNEIEKAFKRELKKRRHPIALADRGLFFDPIEITIDPNLETGNHRAVMKYRDYDFQLHETESEMHKMAERMRAEGWSTAVGTRAQYFRASNLGDAGMMKSRVLARLPDSEYNSLLKNAIAAAYIEMMPETSIRKAELLRKNRRGYSLNLIRGFAEHAAGASHYKAQLEHGNAMKEAMNALAEYQRMIQRMSGSLGTQEADKRSVLVGDIVRELNKRYEIDSMPFNKTAVVDLASQIGFLYMLTGTSYWMIGLTQPWMFGMPVLWAQRAGRKRSTKSTWKYLMDAESAMLPVAMHRAKKAKLGFGFLTGKRAEQDLFSFLTVAEADGKKRTTLDKQIMERIDASDLPNKEAVKAMLIELGERQVLTMGLHTDMQSAARGRDPHGNPVMQWMYVMPQISEMLGRSSVAIAAYNMSRDTTSLKSEADIHAEAVKAAYAAVRDSMFIYDPADRNRYMSGKQPGFGGMARLVFMFQMHSANVYSLMLREFHAWWRTRTDSSPEGKARRKQAVRTIAGVLGTHFAAAGLIGATFEPIKWAWALTLYMLGKLDDEPDEPWEVVMERGLVEAVGPTLGGVLAKGLPYGLLNVDVHGRMNISSLTPLSQMIRYGGQYEGRDAFLAAVATALGPMGSIGANAAEGWKQIVNEGDWVGGLEKTTPRIVKDLVKTYRLGTEGMRDNAGNLTRADHPGLWQMFVTGTGFRTGDEERTATQRSVVFELRSQYEGRKRATLEKIKRLRNEKEFYEAGRVRDDYNRTAPKEYRIESKDVSAMLDRQRKAETSVRKYGVQITPKEKSLRKAVEYIGR